jgi:hypothetical protein
MAVLTFLLGYEGYKDCSYTLGPEFNMYISKPRLTLRVRYEPQFGAIAPYKSSTQSGLI